MRAGPVMSFWVVRNRRGLLKSYVCVEGRRCISNAGSPEAVVSIAVGAALCWLTAVACRTWNVQSYGGTERWPGESGERLGAGVSDVAGFRPGGGYEGRLLTTTLALVTAFSGAGGCA